MYSFSDDFAALLSTVVGLNFSSSVGACMYVHGDCDNVAIVVIHCVNVENHNKDILSKIYIKHDITLLMRQFNFK